VSTPGRCLKKGCPLAPLPLLLVVGGICRFIANAKFVGSFNGINMGGILCVTHLLFVDDIMLFCNGFRREASKLKELYFFSLAIGMVFNERKSTIYFLDLQEDSMVWLSDMFSFPNVDLADGLKYPCFIIKPND